MAAPSTPTHLKVVRTTSTSVTIAWNRPDSPNGNITLYRVMYWPRNNTGTAVGQQWQSNARYVEFTVTQLKPFSTYQIQVLAVNDAGTGEASQPLTVTTDEDGECFSFVLS
ncbi:hypothetical protein V1264_024372 [Littorina saxatilis]|uniref:Fibronectin type-III domain-containing protein n=1 Tax=Littorina saxatilis TaxID=31220 RepID=A0AAN9FYV8_9CAEN